MMQTIISFYELEVYRSWIWSFWKFQNFLKLSICGGLWLCRKNYGHDFLLKQRARLGGPSRYLEHVRKVCRKFSRDIWKKVSPQKMRFCQNILTPFWASFFQNPNFFHFSWHIIWLVCRVVMIFLLTQRAR